MKSQPEGEAARVMRERGLYIGGDEHIALIDAAVKRAFDKFTPEQLDEARKRMRAFAARAGGDKSADPRDAVIIAAQGLQNALDNWSPRQSFMPLREALRAALDKLKEGDPP